MTPDDIRKILALQAVEQADESRATLSDADYREAASDAGAPLPKTVARDGENRFLARRAEVLLIRLTSRFPEATRWANLPASRHRLSLFALVLFLCAAVAGFLTNELGPDKRINILSFPLLGILLWSLLVYLREIALLLREHRRPGIESRTGALFDFLQPALPSPPSPTPGSGPEEETALGGAKVIFEQRWRKLSAPAIRARVKSVLHTTALILAAAAIAGMYVKGLANEYRAVWESTFFSDSSQLRPFLQFVLGPASALSGGSIPPATELAAMHWRAGGPEIPGENAARWIHWYAITIALFVILPRGLLGIYWRFRAARLDRTLPFREISPEYFDHLLAISTGSSLTIQILPYPVSPGEEAKRQILRALEDHFERPVETSWAAAVPFGGEEEPVPGLEGEIIPLFDFAATPEKETHLALYQTLLTQSPNPVRYLLLDTTSFDRKTASLSDRDARKDGRSKAWKNLFEATRVEFLFTGTSNLLEK